MRYKIDQTTGLPITGTSPDVLAGTVFLALLIGVVLLYAGKKGKQMWLTVWSAGLIMCSVLYLLWHYLEYFR